MNAAMKPLKIDVLQPGDVLLHMGTGELSKLIAWVGDSAYSHAAMVIEDAQLIEAAASGVRHASLAERTQMGAHFHFIDVFRPLRPTPGDNKSRAALLAATNRYLGVPYPMTSLITLGIACAVRNKIPGDQRLRRFVRMALDVVIANDSSQVVCSELVYRGFDEAATNPEHSLRLKLSFGTYRTLRYRTSIWSPWLSSVSMTTGGHYRTRVPQTSWSGRTSKRMKPIWIVWLSKRARSSVSMRRCYPERLTIYPIRKPFCRRISSSVRD
ncbi:hypothetical protein [Dokdonella sp.]|uniref:hypothetical protein n=1 Tax=Dokdonella sp. TaxID=2291710 RepID=UPI003C3D8BF9